MNRYALRGFSALLAGIALLGAITCPFASAMEETDLPSDFLVEPEEEETVPPAADPAAPEAEGIALPMDFTEGGRPPKEDGWVTEGKLPVSYEDSTIRVTFEQGKITHKLPSGPYRGRTVTDETWVVRIRIRHPSQLRTAVSRDTYKGRNQVNAADLAKSKNAVVAMNGDFFKYENDVGYVVRQGELIRDLTKNARGILFDMLVIDSEGDFHVVYAADTKKIHEYAEENLAPLGRTVMDTFNIGPALVINGEVQDAAASEVTRHGGREGMYQWSTPIQRIAIVQTGHLEYAMVFVNGRGKRTSGMTMQEFAEFVAEQCPGALLAYNLDGGGSAHIVARGKNLFTNSYLRHITDILYFASAEE